MSVLTPSAHASQAEQALRSHKAKHSLLLDVAASPHASQPVWLAVGWRGHILRSTDNGQNWQQILPPTRTQLTSVWFADANNAWIVGHRATILHSADAGKSWQIQFQEATRQQALFDVWFADSQRGYAVGSHGLALMTEDAGQYWQDISERIYNPDQYHLYGISGSADQVTIAGERDFILGGGVIYDSLDRGQQWRQLAPPFAGTWFGIQQFQPHQTQWAYGVLGSLYWRSAELDQWQAINLDGQTTITAISESQFGVVAVGAKGLVAFSRDGQQFDFQFLPGHRDYTAVAITDDQHLLLTGPHGVERQPLAPLFPSKETSE